MMRRAAGVLALSVALLGVRNARACAGCSNPNLPSARGGVANLAPGQWSVAFNLTGTTMRVVHAETCPDIGPVCTVREEPAQLHDQRFHVAELRPVIGLGITGVLGAEIQAPLRLVRTTIRYRRLDGTAFEPDYENIHHRDETLFGPGDPWLLGRSTGVFGRFALSSRTGVGIPAGSTEPDPFERGRAGRAHQHIQLGTGTFYPVFALDASYTVKPARLAAYGQALLFLYENGYGYRSGNRYSGGGSGEIEVLSGLRIGVGADVLNEQPERWGGVEQADGNVGRTDVLVGGSASYWVGKVSLAASVKLPVWQHFLETAHRHGSDPGQLTYPAIVGLSVATTFGGETERPTSGILP
jgi:hypothetical protein